MVLPRVIANVLSLCLVSTSVVCFAPRGAQLDVADGSVKPTETIVATEPTVETIESTETVETVEPVETVTTEPPAITEPTVVTEPTEVADTVYLGEFKLTAYCPCEKCCGYWAISRPLDDNGNPIVYTASGAVAQAGRTIAVDTSVIPHGTEVIINGHTYVAEDTGSGVDGKHIDIYFNDHEEALEFGLQYADVRIVGS